MFPFSNSRGGGAAAVAASTWNDADKGTGVTLSPDKRTATGPTSAVDSVTRATTSKATGKWSLRVNHTSNFISGLANAAEPNTSYPGATNNSIRYIVAGASKGVFSGGSLISVGSGNSGDSLDIIVDLDLRKVWFIVGGVNVFNGGDPTAGTGGYTCPSGAIFPATDAYNNTQSQTLDTTTSRYSGFPAWG